MDFKWIEPREKFPLNPSIQVKEDWTLGIVDLEVFNSTFNISEQNNKFELYNYHDVKSVSVSYEKVRDEIGKDLIISDTTAIDSEDDMIRTTIIKEHREKVSKRMKDDKHMRFLTI